MPAERELIRSLKSLAKKADEIVIATDFDREGELIGSDAAALVRDVNKKAPIKRARFSAITKDEIERAFAELVEVDECLAQAGESRQDIDLVWGAVLTRYLTMAKFSGYGNVKSAGRVQTPTLALIVERELEREAFVPEIYWRSRARSLRGGEADGDRVLGRARHRPLQERGRGEARHGGRRRRPRRGAVTTAEKKRRKVAPPTPFNTTALQAAAASEGITPGRTMRIAESLYMDGLISYPRVDNTVYPASLDLGAILSALVGGAVLPRARRAASRRPARCTPRAAPRRRPTTRRSTRRRPPTRTSSSPRSGSSTTSSRGGSWRRCRTRPSSRAPRSPSTWRASRSWPRATSSSRRASAPSTRTG